MKSWFLTLVFYLVLVGMMMLGNVSLATNLGVVGETYAILEDDFLTVIETRFNRMKENGEWEKVQTAWREKMIKGADRPNPVKDITPTQTHRIFYVDPTIQLSHDLKGLNGEIISPAGTLINPLTILPLHKTLVFLNADDEKQLKFAMKKEKEWDHKTKWILVDGSVSDTLTKIKKFQKTIYFDQGGTLTKHFHIEHVPALLSQEGFKLKIEECVP